MFDLAIVNGTIVTAEATARADLGISGGRIAAIGLGPRGRGLRARETLDASGKLVLPGAVDEHVHLEMPVGEEEAEEVEDPREELVERLLEYKMFRDAASVLEEQGRVWQEHLPRLANDLPPRRIDPAGQPIQEVELWDLVSAFGRIVRDSRVTHAPSIVYDDTPIHVYMQRIHQRLVQDRRAAFSQLFYPGMHKTAMIGVFLSILELVRHHSVRTEQADGHGEIWVLPGQVFNASLDLSNVDTYGEKAATGQSPELAKAA